MTTYRPKLRLKLILLLCTVLLGGVVWWTVQEVYLTGNRPDDWILIPLLAGGLGWMLGYLPYALTLRVRISPDYLEIRSIYAYRRTPISEIEMAQILRGSQKQLRCTLRDGHRATFDLEMFRNREALLSELEAAGVPVVRTPVRGPIPTLDWARARRRPLTVLAILVWALSIPSVHPLWSIAWPALAFVSQFCLPFSIFWNPRRPHPISPLFSTIMLFAMIFVGISMRRPSWSFLSMYCGFHGTRSAISYARIRWRRARRRRAEGAGR